MRKFTFILCILFSFSLHASAENFSSLVQKASTLDQDGKSAEAGKLYEKAWHLKDDKADKFPVLVELVKIYRNDKVKGLRWVETTEKYLASHPEKKESFAPWLQTMRGYVTGKLDPQSSPAFLKTWAIDQKLPELMKEKKFAEAWELVKARNLSKADLRTQVVHDVLAAVTEKDKSRSQFCESSLKRYPSSQAWTIRVCSYLQGWKKNKSDPELKKTIISQIKDEEPESSYLESALGEL